MIEKEKRELNNDQLEKVAGGIAMPEEKNNDEAILSNLTDNIGDPEPVHRNEQKKNMKRTKEELIQLKVEYKTLNNELKELS